MVHFEDILGQVRRLLEGASLEEVQSLLEELMEAQVLSRDYCLSLAQEGDAEDLVRRISLPLWQNWEACHGTIHLLLHRLGAPCRGPGSPHTESAEMQDVAMDLPEDLFGLLDEVDLLGDLPDFESDCFSPNPYQPFDDGDLGKLIDKIIHSLCEGQEGYLSDEATVPASAVRSEPADQEANAENASDGKRGLPGDVTPGDPKKVKRRRREPLVHRGPRKAKNRDGKHGHPKTRNSKSTVSPVTAVKGVMTIVASPGLVQLGPCTVPRFLHVPIFTSATGGSSFQVIQAFPAFPSQVISIPVSSATGPGRPTYFLVPPPSLPPSPKVMPPSPVAGTVVPPDLAISTPVSSSSDSTNKAWAPAAVSSLSPETERPLCKGSTSPTSQTSEPEKPKCVEEHINSAKSVMRDMCKSAVGEKGVPFELLYVDVGLVERQVQVKTGRNANKCLEKNLVVLGDGDRRRATVARGRLFKEDGEEGGVGAAGQGRSVALLGRSGSGKTAFVRRLCLDWAASSLPRFDFLFLLEGRSLNAPRANHSLRSLLFDLSVAAPSCRDSNAVFRHIVGHPGQVLVVFDGFDDIKDYDGLLQSPACSEVKDGYSVKQLFSGLFQKKILAGCTLLVAARPKEVLNQFLGKVDRIVELGSFSPTEIELYVSRYFAGAPCRDRALRKLWDSGYALSLCSNPLVCRFVCFLLERQGGDRALPPTLTGLCQAVTHQQLRSMIGREQGEEPPRARIPRLCCVAWAGVRSHNSVLTPDELSLAEQWEFGAGGGVLVPFGHRRWDDEEPMGYGFTHLLTQSFLAALHLALSGSVSGRALAARMTGQPRKRLQADWLDTTYRLAIGLLFQKKAPLLDCFPGFGGRDTAAKRAAVTVHLKGLNPGELSTGKLLELCHCVFETGDAKLARHLVRSLPDELSFSGTRLDPPDIFVLHHLLLAAKRTFSLNLQETGVNISGLKELLGLTCISSFRASTGDTVTMWEDLQQENAEGLLQTTVAKFTINPFKATRQSHVDDLTLLVQIYREKKLPFCHFSNSSQSEPTLDQDSFNIPAVRNLQKLDFELGAQQGPTGFSKLVKILPDLRWLQHLDLEDNKIGDSGAETLAEVLPAIASIEMLNLSQNCIGDGGVAKLALALSSLPALLRLSMYSNLIGDAGAENLATVLPQMKSLTDLDVKYNRFSDLGAVKLSESVRNCPWMKTVGMWNHFIPHGVLERLKQQDSRIVML